MVTTVLIIAVLLLIAWLRIDYNLGLKRQKQEAKRANQIIRYGNGKLFSNGSDLFVELFQDIDNAEHHIHILFYIIRDDHIGKRFLKLLESKAKQGVTVRLLVDRIGSQLSNKSIKKLRKAGVHFSYSHKPKFPYFFFTLNRRNHRKITVIDGNIGYIGGFNVGDEYMGRDPKFGPWRDYHIRLLGDGVQDLQEQFLQDWKVATNETINEKEKALYPSLVKGKIPLKILPTDGTYLEDLFLDFIRQAEKTITIGSPYFIPGDAVQSEIINAAKRGVAVRIIVPKKADHPLVKEAAFPYLTTLLKAGCLVYLYTRGFYHTKAIFIDDKLCDIGTANFDKRSFHLNHEINCIIYDKEFIRMALEKLEKDMAISKQLTLEDINNRSIFQRGKETFSTWVSGLL